jgi:RNA polymerase sigma-70 factor (ECF subfamily)
VINQTFDKDLVEVLKGCLRENRQSQKLLYEKFYGYGMSVCIRYARNEDDAIEILNDGFMKVFTGLRKFDFERPFKPWFRRIIINEAINHFKKHEKQMKNEPIREAESNQSIDDILSQIAYEEVVSIIQTLSAAYRTVFNLYVIDGYKHEEISEILGISVGTSKSNLSKARDKLQQLVKEKLASKYV